MTEPGMSLRGELRHQVALADHTTWRVGGPVDRLYRPADLADLAAFLASLDPEEPLLWLGLGSNLLIRDGGWRGTGILLVGVPGGLESRGLQGLYGEAGVTCARLARFAADQGLAGAEGLYGIPGTLGGALAMNAGAAGMAVWDLVDQVTTLDRQGRLRQRPAADFQVGYRSVRGHQGEGFVAAELRLTPDDPVRIRQRMRAGLERRNRTQPIGEASCGSVFRNPPGDSAGRLIEAAGLKGRRVGAAEVSSKHANFIINRGGARAVDIETLITQVQQGVENHAGVRLIPEVRILGETLDSTQGSSPAAHSLHGRMAS